MTMLFELFLDCVYKSVFKKKIEKARLQSVEGSNETVKVPQVQGLFGGKNYSPEIQTRPMSRSLM